jgi:hypothetical protein
MLMLGICRHPAGYGNATAGERSPSPGYYDVKVPSVSLLSVPKRDSFSVRESDSAHIVVGLTLHLPILCFC